MWMCRRIIPAVLRGSVLSMKSQTTSQAFAGSSRQRLRTGMSADEVRAMLGPPAEETVFGGRVRWAYPDLAVVFEGGQVTDLRFY